MKNLITTIVLLIISFNVYASKRLYNAVKEQNVQKVKKLLYSNGVEINIRMEDGRTPLIEAVDLENLEIVTLLLLRDADPNLVTKHYQYSPIMISAEKGNYGLTKLLIDNKAKVNQRSSTGANALTLAVSENHDDVARLLADNGSKLNYPTAAFRDPPLIMAIINKNYDLVRYLIVKGADVNCFGRNWITPLIYLSSRGEFDLVKLLFEYGYTNIDQRKINGSGTALYYSVQNGHNDIAVYLVAKGADINRPHEDTGITPLMLAAKNSNLEIVTLLLKNYVMVTARSRNGDTALSLATDTEIRELLIASGGRE